MYVPKWLVVMLAIVAVILVADRAISRPQLLAVPVGLIIRDGNNHPLHLNNGATIILFRAGQRSLSRSEWIVAKGRPDNQGYLRTNVSVKVDHRMVDLVQQVLK